jgi:hypothetical protein
MAPGYRVAQVRAVFHLPRKASTLFDAGVSTPKHLAYVEWFSTFPSSQDQNHGLYKIMRSFNDGKRLASIIEVSSIQRSIHLFPKFGRIAPRHWTSNNVLEECNMFFVNAFSDRHSYLTIY